MARYFFNIRIGNELIADHEGDELPDADAARQLALETLGDMRRLPHVYGEPIVWETREFVITNEQGDIVVIVPFNSTNPAPDTGVT